MATFEKEWQSKANIPLSITSSNRSTASLLFNIKEALVGNHGATSGKWSVVRSSNGTAVDNSDLWQTLSDVVSPANGNPRSWIVLKSPGVVPYWLVLEFQFNTSGTVVASVRAEFYTAEPTGGTTTVAPTGTGLIGGFNKGFRGYQHIAGVGVNFCYSLADDGSFVALWNQEGAGYFCGALIFSKLAESKPLDPHPVLVISVPVSTSTSQTTGAIFNDLGGTGVFGIHPGVSVPALGTSSRGCLLMLRDIVSSTSVGMGYVADSIPTDPGDGDGSIPDWHIYVGSRETSGAPNRSLRGRVPDFRWAPLVQHGAMSPDVIAPDSMAVGYLWVPMKEVHNLL